MAKGAGASPEEGVWGGLVPRLHPRRHTAGGGVWLPRGLSSLLSIGGTGARGSLCTGFIH